MTTALRNARQLFENVLSVTEDPRIVAACEEGIAEIDGDLCGRPILPVDLQAMTLSILTYNHQVAELDS